jgi:hypothetical protein
LWLTFFGQVIHPFDAQADGELSIAMGDYVVVRQVRIQLAKEFVAYLVSIKERFELLHQ